MSQGPYKMGTIARLSGFSPELLRAWERRYDLLDPKRGSGGQRLYDDDDLRVLKRVRALMDEGRSIGEIARAGRKALLGPTAGLSPPASQATDANMFDAWRRAIIDAAVGLDSASLMAALDEAIIRVGAERSVHDVIVPCAHAIGDLWASGECSVAGEHMASEIFIDRVHGLLNGAQPARPAAPCVVAACFPHELHELGLLIAAWRVARLGFRVTYLGPALPFDDLAHACASLSARAVLLSVSRRAVYRRCREDFIGLASRKACRWPLFIGGQGVPTSDPGLPARKVTLVGAKTDLEAATGAIAAVR